jgi:ABC-type lipoprotein export system ATPase subunit
MEVSDFGFRISDFGFAMTPSDVILETRNVCKYYRRGTAQEVRAVDGVSVAIARGSFAALTGPSGSGKTTLLALLGALERPSGGQVLYHGRDLSDCSDVELSRTRRRMGFVFQDFALIPTLTVGENITYPLVPRGVRPAARRARAEALLARLGLKDRLRARPHELSGGEQQRVALARAMAGQPEAILADEPVSNLDLEAGRSVLTMLQEIHAEGTTIILTTHDPEAISLATCVHTLAGGKLLI